MPRALRMTETPIQAIASHDHFFLLPPNSLLYPRPFTIEFALRLAGSGDAAHGSFAGRGLGAGSSLSDNMGPSLRWSQLHAEGTRHLVSLILGRVDAKGSDSLQGICGSSGTRGLAAAS